MRNSITALLMTMTIIFGITASSPAGVTVTNPTGLKQSIDTLGYAMQDQVGNYGLTQFNSNLSKLTFPFDDAFGYNVVASNQLDSVILTKAGSGVDLTVTFLVTAGSGYGRIRTADAYTNGTRRATSTSVSDGYALAYKYAAETASITFSRPLQGVGLTVTRLIVDANISLYDAISGGNLIATYKMPFNSGSGRLEHSLFGYYSPSSAVQRIVISAPGMGGTQFYVDDLAVIFPLCTDNPLPGDMNKDCYVNFSDLSVFAAHWLSSNF